MELMNREKNHKVTYTAESDFEYTYDDLTKQNIWEFIDQHDIYKTLKRDPIIKWQLIAKKIGSQRIVNSVRYYCLYDIADELLNNPKKCRIYYDNHKPQKKLSNSIFGVVEYHKPSPTKMNPLRTCMTSLAGIIIGDHLFYKHPLEVETTIRKIPLESDRVSIIKQYDTYFDLAKNNKQYKQTKQVFNSIMKEKGI